MTIYGGRYRVLEKLGAGGMATVFLAEDERLGRQVALKRMRAETTEEGTERFRREAQLAASLNHPNVVKVYDTLADEDDVLIVMEYVKGIDLGERLKEGPVAPPVALRVLRDAAAGLDHAHDEGLIHRDIKPQNILIGEKGDTKITDLGIAKAAHDTGLTQTGSFIGTAQYMAPEQIEGKPVTRAADIYSLALIGFAMLTGRAPRGEGSVPELVHRAVNMPPPDLREAWPEAPGEAVEVMARALAREPAVRPATATKFVEAMARALEGTPTAAAPTLVAPAAEASHEDSTAALATEAAPPIPDAPSSVHRAYPRWLVPLLAALTLVAVATAVATAVGGGDDEEPIAGGGDAAAANQGERGPVDEGGGDGPPAGDGGEATLNPDPPAQAVIGFYKAAAAGNYARAAALATPDLEAELGPLEGPFSTLETIEFTRIATHNTSGSSARISFATIATHAEFIDICAGVAAVISSQGRWVVDDLAAVECRRSE